MTDSRPEPRDTRHSAMQDPAFEFHSNGQLADSPTTDDRFWMRLDVQVLSVFAISVLLSTLAWSTSDGINPDGILYVETADAYMSDGFGAALAMYEWPFFSILIGSFAKISGTSCLFSAQLLSSLLLAAFCGGFIAVCREAFPDPRVGWGALITISSMLGLNEYRDYVIRDFGFWAFLILSTWCLSRAVRAPMWANLFSFQLCIGVAFLFRMEAIVFAALGPLALLLSQQNWRVRLISYFKCNLPILLVLACIFFFFNAEGQMELASSSVLEQIRWYASLDSAEVRIANFRGEYFEKEIALNIITTGLIGFLIIKTATKIGFAGLALGLYPLLPHSKYLNPSPAVRVVVWMLVIAIIIPFYFLMNKAFFQGRFAIPLAIFSLILITGNFRYVFDHFSKRRVTSGILIFLFVLTLADAFIQTGNSKQHLIEAANWVKKEFPDKERLLSNHGMLDFYGGREAYYRGQRNASKANDFQRLINRVDDYDILLIREKGDPVQEIETLREEGAIELLRSFEGTKKGRVVRVFRVIH